MGTRLPGTVIADINVTPMGRREPAR